jgi:beta-1,4-galactosyltransferase 1
VVAEIRNENQSLTALKIRKKGVEIGGKYKPKNCKSRHKVAIVVPYRDRRDQLKIFLSYMHSFLQRQQLEYTIFVVEQSGKPFFYKVAIKEYLITPFSIF